MSAPAHRIVFLYSELAGYFLACAEALGAHPSVESVDIVHWAIHPEAPFQFSSTPQYTLHPKAAFDRNGLHALLDQIQPTAIICSGWMDADYNAMAKRWCKRIPVVLTLDNWWTGSLKQWIAVLTAPLYIRKMFNRAWVPGAPQKPFAEKLGFKSKTLSTGFYCADPRPFEQVYKARKDKLPSKRLLYVGRYSDFKGVRELWSAFSELSDDFPQWELHCIGTGDLWEERMVHPRIFHHGFLQPYELPPHLVDATAFIMPSKKEPWGVVLHEMALAGLPLFTSVKVGASSRFLHPRANGFRFEPTSKGLRNALSEVLQLSSDDLTEMGNQSRLLATSEMPSAWVHRLLTLV
jgi:glycosyltransferase involved in cell wall biosynthesis